MLKNTSFTLLVHIFLVILFSISSLEHIASQSIDHCGTMGKHKEMTQNDPEYKKNRMDLEKEIKKLKNGITQREQDLNGIITIPVVFHVIHNGDPIGTNAFNEDNENLPDFLLEAQIQQINEDFRRTSGYPSYTPQAFLDVAADTEIEFCLASVDEYGYGATGIIRHDINDLSNVSEDSVWTSDFIDTYIKQATIWDNSKFLNIWVVKKIESIDNDVVSNTTLGYAHLPGGPQFEDGIVLRSTIVGGPDDTNATFGHPLIIGSGIPNVAGYRRGRTGTHEVGHYLNLYHVWGVEAGSPCTQGDLVDDTPNAEESTSSLNACDTFSNTCADSPIDQPNMHQNHMDYGNGDCKTIFTLGQKTRMLDAIMLSRPGLLTSSCQATPINDLITDAGYIDCDTNNEAWGTFNATSSDSPDACDTPITTPGVWFELVGNDNTATISFCYSDYIPSVNVYKYVGSELTCVASTINYCTETEDPKLTFNAAGSCSYYIYVSGYTGNGSNSILNLSVTCEDLVCPSSTKIYVDKGFQGCGDGSSWTNAITDLQEAMDRASECGIDTILVAGGTYYPTSSPDDVSTDLRDRSFHLNTDVVVIGGYNPVTGTPSGIPSILTGANNNSYHVMINTGLTSATVFENLTIRDGNANGSPSNDMIFEGIAFDRQYGGGVYNKSSQPIYSNCVFTNNQATLIGGGLYLTTSNATVNNCDFTSNTAADGGGIGSAYSSTSTISNSTFKSNIATSTGGGIANVFSSQSIITNCVLIENVANDGGGIANSGASIDIINCTLTANSTSNSAGLFASASTSISNTILWGNGTEIDGTVMINNSIVEGGYTGCIDCPNINGDIDPLFIDATDPEGQDFILGTADDGIALEGGSLAINSGNSNGAPSKDITGASRIGNVDLGAYEGQCQVGLIYVNANATGNGNGSSWANGYIDLQDAMDQAKTCGVATILVAEGTYYPTSSPDDLSTDLRDRAFHLNIDVIIKGGYEPSTGIQNGEASILSGEIGAIGDILDNTYHVMINTGLTAATVFEGLTFSDGYANGDEADDMAFGGTFFDRQHGGGLYNSNSDPSYSNCVFIDNHAIENGGGLYIEAAAATVNNCTFTYNSAVRGGGMANSNSSPTLTNCTFTSNSAIEGGGMHNLSNSSPTLTTCIFKSNSATNGGGMTNSDSSPTLTNCTFTSNFGTDGGGMTNSDSSPSLTNCTFKSNSTVNLGGGMRNLSNSSPTLTNCNFTSNKSTSFTGAGGGMYNFSGSPILTGCNFMSNSANNIGGAIRNNANSSVLTDCIFTSNTAPSGGGLANNNCTVSLTDCTFYVPPSNLGILNQASATTTIQGTVELIKNYVTDMEGNSYKTIQIGDQVWMAENLNIGTMIDGVNNQTDNDIIEKYCYDDNPANCDLYGGLYLWNEIMQYTTIESAQGVCPVGWHLPSFDDWNTLANTLGGASIAGGKMKTTGTLQSGDGLWNTPNTGATDESRFSGLPGGFRSVDNSFYTIGVLGEWWSSTELDAIGAWDYALHQSNIIFQENSRVKELGNSVRCVQD